MAHNLHPLSVPSFKVTEYSPFFAWGIRFLSGALRLAVEPCCSSMAALCDRLVRVALRFC
jgi:hypothetical protein